MPTVRLTLPMATGDYANAVRAAQRHGLRVWLESDLVGRVRGITDKPVSHVEVGRAPAAVAAAVAEGGEH